MNFSIKERDIHANSITAWKASPKYFAIACVVIATAFACFTNHAWEDYYITYRVSKNLATGNGLVYTVGERVHVFTSPLNVLLPAAFSAMTGNRSDDLALWLYRFTCIASLGVATWLFTKAAVVRGFSRAGIIAAGALLILDSKVIDFTINGQEVGLMMLFLAMVIHAINVSVGRRQHVELGCAFAGLMWTRPDGMVYGGLIMLAILAFPTLNGRSRREWFVVIAKASTLGALLYLPWLFFAWWYFGSPIPHTVVAKSLFRTYDILSVTSTLIMFLLELMGGGDRLLLTFAPPYHFFGGWPSVVGTISGILAWVAAWCWIVPRGDAFSRAMSFAFAASVGYLAVIAPTPEPWYVPSTTILGAWVVGYAVSEIQRSLHTTAAGPLVHSIPLFLAFFAGTLLVTTAIQMKARQEIVETGNRLRVANYLKAHAIRESDTCFAECLGYIGYFANLKMYDFPGLSSPEMVDARRRLQMPDWDVLINELRPNWLVLRPREVAAILQNQTHLLNEVYSRVAVFDVSEEIGRYSGFPGAKYTTVDSVFLVFRRN